MERRDRQHIDKRMEVLRKKRLRRNRRLAIIVLEILIIICLSYATYMMFKTVII